MRSFEFRVAEKWIILKIDLILFVPVKLTFSKYLRCLNFPLWILWPAKTEKVLESNLFCDTAPTKSGKFKHLKLSENVSFVETNSVDSILDVAYIFTLSTFEVFHCLMCLPLSQCRCLCHKYIANNWYLNRICNYMENIYYIVILIQFMNK